MRIQPTLLLAIFLCSACLAACHADGGAGSVVPEPSQTLPGPQLSELRIDAERRTTRADIAVANLNANVSATEEHYERTQAASVRSRLLDLLALRTSMLGLYGDFDTMARLTEQAVDVAAPTAAALLERAAFLSAVHRFDEASALLSTVTMPGTTASAASTSSAQALRGTIAVAQGRDLEGLLSRVEEEAALRDDHDAYARLAIVQAALGQFDKADQSFRDALSRYKDSSPFIVAWNSFQRGVMWAESAGRPDLARPLYENAVTHLPDYVVANVHLAELEAQDGELGRAIARLQRLVDAGVTDPEPAGRLAELLLVRREPGDNAASAALKQAASARYDALLGAYPEAFSDHGAEFFAGIGDNPRKSLALALGNLKVRRTPRSFLVALRSASAASDKETYCRLADEAQAASTHHPVLEGAIQEASPLCAGE